jgi:hypothetical protein
MIGARLSPASPDDLADALAFALRFDGRNRKNDVGEFMAKIVAKRLVDQLPGGGNGSQPFSLSWMRTRRCFRRSIKSGRLPETIPSQLAASHDRQTLMPQEAMCRPS